MAPLTCSFDVFDTCLVRSVASGAHIVAEAARRSAITSSPLDEEVIAEAVRLRVLGESRACADGRDAALLAEAYAAAPEIAGLGIDPTRMHAEELRLESAGLRPVACTARRIAEVRAQGHRVLFVSDMHLPSALLRQSLERHGMAEPGDHIYVSGELGVSKLTGRLYDHVLRAEGLRPEDVLHRGDDAWTDLRMARERGLQVDPFPQGRLNRYERAVMHGCTQDDRTRSRLVAASRVVRLGEPSGAGAAELGASIGADVVGPLLSGYVRWVLDDARVRGVQTLCFVSRDGQVLHEIAQRIRRRGDPECRYLYGSRQAWFIAGVVAGEAADLAWVFEPKHERATVRSVMAKVGLSPEDAVDELKAAGLDPDGEVDPSAPGACGQLIKQLRPYVLASAQRARDLLSDYLEQEGLLDGRSWAIVDVGWYLNAQASLRQALAPEIPMSGYYLAVREGRRSLRESGPFRARVREDAPGDRVALAAGWLLEVPNLVEHVFVRADHGQCTGYERRGGRVVPILRPARQPPQWFPALRAAVLQYATIASEEGLLDDGGAAAFASGALAGRLLALQPTREEAVLLGSTLVSDDQNESALRLLAPPLALDDVVRQLRRRLLRREAGPADWQHWPAGTWSASGSVVQATVRSGRASAPLVRRTVAWVRTARAKQRGGHAGP